MASPTSTSELHLPAPSDVEYQEYRKQTDLREPYRLPDAVLKEVKKKDMFFDVAESPMIAFINSRSGGRAGPQLLTTLHQALGNAQVFDVLTDRPDVVLEKIWRNLDRMQKEGDLRVDEIRTRLKIVTCGGDGTVAWVLKVIKELKMEPAPAVCIVPLGTGNDLSRTFKWGHTFQSKWIRNASNVYDHLKRMADGEALDLDCWQIDIEAPVKEYFADLPHSLKPSNDEGTHVSGMSWNYVSIGMDAQSAYGFHHLREDHPAFASGRMINQFWYSFYGLKSGWFCCCNALNPPINRSISIEVMTKDDTWKKLEISDAVKAIVILNLQSYAGGRNIWGKGKLTKKDIENGFVEPSLDDGMFEVVGFRTGYHTGFVMVGLLHCMRLGQGKAARIQVQRLKNDPSGEVEAVYMQIDGEPWKQRIPVTEKETLKINIVRNGVSRLLTNQPQQKTVSKNEDGPSNV